MEAEPDHVSDSRPDTGLGDGEEYGSAPFDRMVFPRPAPDDNPQNLPKSIPAKRTGGMIRKPEGRAVGVADTPVMFNA